MEKRIMGKFVIFLVLLLLLLARFLMDEEHSEWIQLIGFAGVVVALVDLYGNVYSQFEDKDKFNVITGFAIIILFVIAVVIVGMILDFIVLDNRGNDCLTILALLISLPADLYCNWINKYVID